MGQDEVLLARSGALVVILIFQTDDLALGGIDHLE
jgi:hypothetical protein